MKTGYTQWRKIVITNNFDLKPQRAFTLIELMVVVAIIGILASVAFPSYQRSVSKSRMTDTKGVLLEFANAMERYYTEFNTYCNAAGAGAGDGVCGGGNDNGIPIATLFPATSPIDGSTVYYNLRITLVPALTGTSYTLTAAPVGVQANNICGTLSLTSTGLRTFTGAGGTRLSCW